MQTRPSGAATAPGLTSKKPSGNRAASRFHRWGRLTYGRQRHGTTGNKQSKSLSNATIRLAVWSDFLDPQTHIIHHCRRRADAHFAAPA